MSEHPAGTWSYRPGSWFGVFGSATTLLLPGSEKARVVDLWARVDDGAKFDEVLDALLAGGLGSLPGFVLVGADERLTKILVRGASVSASVTSDGAEHELDGGSAATWVERTFDVVTAMTVTVDGSDPDATDLPIHGGLVRIGRADQPPVPPAPTPSVAAGLDPTDVDTAPDPALDEPVEPPPAPGFTFDKAPTEQPIDDPVEVEQAASSTDELFAPGARHLGEPITEETPADLDAPAFPPLPPAPFAPPPPAFGAAPPYDHADTTPPPPADAGSAEVMGPVEPPPTDHDGLTQVGVDASEFARSQPGIPGQPMTGQTVRPVARLMISNGEQVDVDRVVLIGRAPEARRFTTTDQPRLVTVPSPLHEISSTHVEVRPGSGADHGSAVVTDMGSTNGTILEQPGLAPEELKPGIAMQLIPGALINLGDGVTISVAHP